MTSVANTQPLTSTTISSQTQNNLNNNSSVQRSSSRNSNKSQKYQQNGKLPKIQLSPADNRCLCYTNAFPQDTITMTTPRPAYSYASTTLLSGHHQHQERPESKETSLTNSHFVPYSIITAASPVYQFIDSNYNNSFKSNRQFLCEPNNNFMKIANNSINNNDSQPVCCYCSQCNPTSPKFPFCAACAASSGKLKRTTYKSASIAVPSVVTSSSPRITNNPGNFNNNSNQLSVSIRSPPAVPSSPLLQVQPKDHHLIFESTSSHGCFRKSVPSMPMIIAIFCCLFNFFIPGSGTLLASISVLFGCSTEYGKSSKTRAFLLGIFIGIIQMVTAIFVLGWVWSIMWGINFIKHSSMESEKSLYPDHTESFEVSSNTTSIYSNNNMGYIKEANSV